MIKNRALTAKEIKTNIGHLAHLSLAISPSLHKSTEGLALNHQEETFRKDQL